MRKTMEALPLFLCLLAAATVATVAGLQDYDGDGGNNFVLDATERPKRSLQFVYPMKNSTRTVGEALKLKCEVRGSPPPSEFRWFVNEAPLVEERGRVKRKDAFPKSGGEGVASSRIRFRELDVHDTGFYRCEASNGADTVSGESILKVTMPRQQSDARQLGGMGFHDANGDNDYFYDEDYDEHDESKLVPQDFPLDFDSHLLKNGIDGLPPHITHPDNSPMPRQNRLTGGGGANLPSLKPTEQAGTCQRYTGTICSEYILPSDLIFVSRGLTQAYIEQKLQAALQVITASPDLRRGCSKYAIKAICLSTLPLCDRQTRKPRKVCRDECETLEYDICSQELAIARSQPMINHQLVLPVCHELPVVGSTLSYNCVRLGIPHVTKLIRPHGCYVDDGAGYRGTVSVTQSGRTCKPWHLNLGGQKGLDGTRVELVGGHNYCRNPDGPEKMSQPWCYTNDPRRPKEVCGIPECSDGNLWLYIVLPAAGAVALVAAILCAVYLRRRHSRRRGKKPTGGISNGNLLVSSGNNSTIAASEASPRSLITGGGSHSHPSQQSHHNYSEMEMNSLMPPTHQPPQLPPPAVMPQQHQYHHLSQHHHLQNQHQQQQIYTPPMQVRQPPRSRAREFPITSVRFNQELGEGAFGKVYKGDLGGIIGGCSTHVAIKTLRPGSNTQTKADFQRDIELWSDLRHPNVVMLIGVVLKDDPQCMIFEYLAQGDLHEFLLSRNTKPESSGTLDNADRDRALDSTDMSFFAIQIASGLEYLASQNFVHRDVAARNCLVGENMSIKISDLGLCRDIYASDYYRVQSKSLLPVRWMPPESILYGKFTTESDVWSFGVLMWEIYSFGQQPYYGYSNQEVIEMIRSRQLLPCPDDCPSRMYAFMVECWHEIPTRRPQFGEIHARLVHWEGVSTGYQSTSHSMASGGSQHSSTGPSNNTGSTNLSQNMLLQQQQQLLNKSTSGSLSGGYSRPFGHLLDGAPKLPQPPAAGMVQVASGPNGAPQTVLWHQSNGGGGAKTAGAGSNGQASSSIASLQMV